MTAFPGGARRAAKAASILHSEIDGELVLLDPHTNAYYGLNAVGSFIWSHLAAGETLDEVREGLVNAFDIDAATAWADLLRLVTELTAEGLLVLEPGVDEQ